MLPSLVSDISVKLIGIITFPLNSHLFLNVKVSIGSESLDTSNNCSLLSRGIITKGIKKTNRPNFNTCSFKSLDLLLCCRRSN